MAGADYYVVIYSPEYLYWPCVSVFNLHPHLTWFPNIYSQHVSLFNWLVHVCLGYCMIKLVPKFKDGHDFTGRHLCVCCRWLITRVVSPKPTPLGAYVLTQWHQDWRSNDVNDLINTHWWFDFVLFMLQHTTTRSEVWASSRELQLLFNYVTMISLPLI